MSIRDIDIYALILHFQLDHTPHTLVNEMEYEPLYWWRIPESSKSANGATLLLEIQATTHWTKLYNTFIRSTNWMHLQYMTLHSSLYSDISRHDNAILREGIPNKNKLK